MCGLCKQSHLSNLAVLIVLIIVTPLGTKFSLNGAELVQSKNLTIRFHHRGAEGFHPLLGNGRQTISHICFSISMRVSVHMCVPVCGGPGTTLSIFPQEPLTLPNFLRSDLSLAWSFMST